MLRVTSQVLAEQESSYGKIVFAEGVPSETENPEQLQEEPESSYSKVSFAEGVPSETESPEQILEEQELPSETENPEQLQEEPESSYSQVSFAEAVLSETEEPKQITVQSQADKFAVNTEASCSWHDASTKLLLSLMEEMHPKLGKSVHVKTKSKMYQLVAEKMAVEGYVFTRIQIENKFRGLERSYKKTVLNDRKTGRNRQNFPYESELHRILGEKKGIYPEFLLDSGDPLSFKKSDDYSDTDYSPKDDVQSPGPSQKKRSKVGVQQKVMEKKDEILAQSQADKFAVNTEASCSWHDASTKLLLSLMEEMRPKLGKSVHVKTKSKMYQLIAEKMAVEGYVFTGIQIENKFRGLERSYKKTVLNNRQTGRNRQTFPYENELHRILGEKKGIYLELLLDSGDPLSFKKSNDYSDTDYSPKDDVQSPGPFQKKRSKVGVQQKMMEKMGEILAQKKEFHNKVLDLLQKKEERAQRREELAQRKLELLETLVRNKSD